MRISDWSSDVCSSDLEKADYMRAALDAPTARGVAERLMYGALDMYSCPENPNGCLGVITSVACGAEAECIRGAVLERGAEIGRASCRERVFSTCRSRWSPYH